MTPVQPNTEPSYAVSVANRSYEWYSSAAVRSRRLHRWSAALLQVVAAAIPLSAVLWPNSAVVPAILGAIVVIIAGLRSTFLWQENYLRFSGSREAVEAERRRYHTGAPPYADPEARDKNLVNRITRIENSEMSVWQSISAEQPKQP